MRGLVVVVLAALLAAVAAHDIKGRVHIVPQPVAADGSVVAVQPGADALSTSARQAARVVLNGGEYVTTTRADGSFSLSGVHAGVYLVEVFHPTAVYPTYKLNVREDDAPQVVEYRYPGAPRLPSRYPLEARPVAGAFYFEEKPSMSLLGMLRSPQVLMMGFMVIMMLCMRGVTSNPEAMREMREQQAAMGAAGDNPMGMLMGMLTGQGAPAAAAEAPAAGRRNAGAAAGPRQRRAAAVEAH